MANPRKIFDTGLLYHHYANTAYPLTPSSFREYRIGDREELPALLSAEWGKVEELSLYMHIPFCKVRCKFCEYAVLEGEDAGRQDEYVELLLRELSMYAPLIKGKRLAGFDLGGGTPTMLSEANLDRIRAAVDRLFPGFGGVTASIETTPVIAANEPEKLAEAWKAGFRRISMGIQTVSERLLNDLGREGTAHIYETAARAIRATGFRKFNIDLMYGFLHQSDEDFESTIRYAASLGPDYITLYRNRYKGTKLEGEAEGVSLYRIIRQYRLAHETLLGLGYRAEMGKNTFSRLEGDYGTSDYLSRRVVDGLPYLGLGLGAQSFGLDYLSYNEGAATKRLAGYRQALVEGRFPVQDAYRLPLEESIAKTVSVAFYFGFVDLCAFERRFGLSFTDHFRDEVDFVLSEGLMERGAGRLSLTSRGADYINGVIPLFYSERSKAELLELASRRATPDEGERLFLSAYNIEAYPRPSLAVDIVVTDETGGHVLLVRRGEHPFMNDWALPGGFVRPGESAEAAARRELREEAGVTVTELEQVAFLSDPGRDPRGWIVSCVFAARAEGSALAPRHGDDALEARLFDVRLEDIGNGQVRLALADGELRLSATLQKAPGGGGFRVLEQSGLAFDHAAAVAGLANRLAPEGGRP